MSRETIERTKMLVEFGVHDRNQLLQGRQLLLHSALVTQEILFLSHTAPVSDATERNHRRTTHHAIHNLHETPKRHLLAATHHNIHGGAKVRHSLNIA